MPYAVPPPEPPAIISQLSVISTQESAISSQEPTTDNPLLTTDKPLALSSQESDVSSKELTTDNSVLSPAAHQNIPATILATPPLPETESLPDRISAGKSAAMLGSPLSVVVPSQATTSNIVSEVEWGSLAKPGNEGKQIAELNSVSAFAAVDEILGSGKSEDVGISYFTLRDTKLTQTPSDRPTDFLEELEPSPTPDREILPAEHIGRTLGTLRNRRQNQRRSSQNRTSQNRPQPPTTGTPANIPPTVGVIELFADRLDYDTVRQIFTGVGNVEMRYQGGVLTADRVQGNLVNRVAVAEGRAAFRRGQQDLRGQRIVYNFVQDSGNIRNGSGEIFLPATGTDLAFNLPNTGVVPPVVADRPLSDRLLAGQAQQVSNVGGINLVFGGTRPGSGLPAAQRGGLIQRVRFEAENIDFYPRGLRARNVRFTNDPFSPPELEIRADQAIVTRVSPLRDEVALTRPRLVFDQGFALPIPRSRYVFDRTEREPPIVQFGYDQRERGGVYIYRNFEVYRSDRIRFSLTPQFFLQRAISEGFGNPPELFGIRARFSATVGPRTIIGAAAVVNNFAPELIEEKIRASTRLIQVIGDPRRPHRLTLEYSYRDQLFNGSLGYQTVQQSLGAVLTSPVFALGKTGAILTYQVGGQYINADTDRVALLAPVRTNNRTDLGRFQTSVSVSRGISLWRGKPLPATPSEGLRYTPVPVVPFISLIPSVSGTTSLYTNGETQNTFTGTLSLVGQFGHFSRPFLDYTGFNIRFTRVFRNGESPFFFDRVVDERVFSFGITQQLYGPFRIGFQTAINLDTNKSISTDYFLEYSRRAYGITLRYNPELQLGAILFRVSDFNWNNGGEPFGGNGLRFVDFGIIQDY